MAAPIMPAGTKSVFPQLSGLNQRLKIQTKTFIPQMSTYFVDNLRRENNVLFRSRLDISPEFSFSHMLEFSKLGVAYVATLAGWA